MTQKEKLIEQIGIHCAYTGNVDCKEDCTECLADHLIANGVVVLPVKVGGSVYIISCNKVKECEIMFVGLSKDEELNHFNFAECYADGTFRKSHSMCFDDIGRTVFITREEAERALAERFRDEEDC